VITNRQKALIHVARQKTGMTEDEYRALLSGFGVQSSTQLSQVKFESVMAHFAKMGFRRLAGASAKHKTSRELLRGKVRKLLIELHLTDSYVDGIAKSRFGVDTWAWLDAKNLHKLVAMLVYHQQRQRKKAG
jgi:phage gp16-like protein